GDQLAAGLLQRRRLPGGAAGVAAGVHVLHAAREAPPGADAARGPGADEGAGDGGADGKRRDGGAGAVAGVAVARGVAEGRRARDRAVNNPLSSRLTREKALKHEEPSFAWPACCSTSFAPFFGLDQ